MHRNRSGGVGRGEESFLSWSNSLKFVHTPYKPGFDIGKYTTKQRQNFVKVFTLFKDTAMFKGLPYQQESGSDWLVNSSPK